MAELSLETVIKSGVEKALNKPIVDGKSITEWAAIGMKAPRWISVKDHLPEKSEYVISYGQGEFYVCKYSVRHKAFNADDYDGGDFYKLDSITHWMPLPEPPEEENDEHND